MGLALVTGGTGTLGRVVVEHLHRTGERVRVLSRRPPPADPGPTEWAIGDLATGAGLASAVQGVDVVLHCATDGRRPQHDVLAARRLVAGLQEAGSGHLVYISIVGVDRLRLPYYRAKFAVEQLVETSGLPWTILRATQFHDLVAAVFAVSTRLPVVVVPSRTTFQPVEVAAVARRLVEVAREPAAGRVLDLGGPEVRSAADLARAYLDATGRHRAVLPVTIPGPLGRGFREGHQLTPDRISDGQTFEDFLAERFGEARPTRRR